MGDATKETSKTFVKTAIIVVEVVIIACLTAVAAPYLFGFMAAFLNSLAAGYVASALTVCAGLYLIVKIIQKGVRNHRHAKVAMIVVEVVGIVCLTTLIAAPFLLGVISTLFNSLAAGRVAAALTYCAGLYLIVRIIQKGVRDHRQDKQEYKPSATGQEEEQS